MSSDITIEVAMAIAQERWIDVPTTVMDGYFGVELREESCRVLAAEIERLKAIVDAIPGDDKLAVAEWCVEFTRWNLICADKSLTFPERSHALRMVDRYMDCPPSVRAALRSTDGVTS